MPGYVKFTGEYKKLKSMGYMFQKLYAGNYMSWYKNNGLIIWKRGGDIQAFGSNYNLYLLIEFMRSHPKLLSWDNGNGGYRYSFIKKTTNPRSWKDRKIEYLPCTEENMDMMRKNYDLWRNFKEGDQEPPLVGLEPLPQQIIDDLKELNKLGWYELVEIDDDEM